MTNTELWLRYTCRTADGPYLRPFAANAAWSSAEVFVVGTNPATPLRDQFESFENYWRALTLDVEQFLSVYRQARSGEDSRTTARTRELLGYLLQVNTLVTNSFAYPAKGGNRIPKKSVQKAIGRDIFTALMDVARPRAVILHGEPAADLACWYFGQDVGSIQPIEEQDLTLEARSGYKVRILRFPHFSGQGAPKGYTGQYWSAQLQKAAARVTLATQAA